MSGPPVYPQPFPDPFVLTTSDGYFAYGTNARGSNVQVMSSPDLERWTPLPDALPVLARWAAPNFTWSPAVLARPGGYVLYYAARVRGRGQQGISVATARDPAGPFVDRSSRPFIYQQDLGGSIDPSLFVDVDGSAHLLWKADANAIRRPSSLWIAELSPDGLDAGRASPLLEVDQAWEAPLIEAPCLVTDGGRYFLFYSASWWNTDRYAIGYATASARLGPYEKQTLAGGWFTSDGWVAGPGGQEWFRDHEGGWRMAYHGWEPGRVRAPGAGRLLHIDAVTLGPDGPVFLS